MGNFWTTMLGGDVPPTSKQKNMDMTPSEYKGLRATVADLFSQGTSGDKGALSLAGVPSSGGDYTAALTGNEAALLDQLMQRAAGPTQPMTDADRLLNDTMAGKYLFKESNPALQNSISTAQAPISGTWQDVLRPLLQSTYGDYTARNAPSPFSTAVDQALQGYQQHMASTDADMAYANYAAERKRQMGAVDQAQKMDAQSYKQLTDTLQAEALPRLIEQHGIDQGVAEYQARLSALLDMLNTTAGATTGQVLNVQPDEGQLLPFLRSLKNASDSVNGGTGNSTDWNTGGGSGGGSSMSSGMAMAAAAYSDARLKVGIRPLGAAFGSTPLVEFSYIWAPARRLWGVLAQQAPARARIMTPSGFWAVNYSKLIEV